MKPVKKKKNTKHESKSLFKMALNWKIGNPIKGKYKKKKFVNCTFGHPPLTIFIHKAICLSELIMIEILTKWSGNSQTRDTYLVKEL